MSKPPSQSKRRAKPITMTDTIVDAPPVTTSENAFEIEVSGDSRPAQEPRQPMHRSVIVRWTYSLLVNLIFPLAFLAAAILAVIWLGEVEPAQRPPADTSRTGRLKSLPPVRIERLQTLEEVGTPLQLAADGVVIPFRESRVAAEIAGRVVFKSPECESGVFVKKNQLLMRIDPQDYELEVQRLTRMREQEYQSLKEIDQEMTNTARLIKVAQKDLEIQQQEVDRIRSMGTEFSSRDEIDKAKRALLSATQALVTVENQLSLLRKRRGRLEASERLAGTQLRVAELNLERTEIRAPIDGVIVSEEADLNTFVARGSTLVVIEDTSKVEVASKLRMDQLYWVLDQADSPTDVPGEMSRGYDLPDTPAIIEYELSGRQGVVYRWQGKLLSYNGIGLDQATRTVPVRLLVESPQEMIDENGDRQDATGSPALVRGMYVRVKLLIKPKTPLVVIPARALQPGNRVFQFMPDESVLETPADPASSNKVASKEATDSDRQATPNDTTKEPLASSEADSADEIKEQASAKEKDAFDPSRWDPGKVFVRSSITPVDTLTVDMVDPSETDSDTLDDVGNRMWVCEVRDDGILQAGSYVVVSPLGGIDNGSIAVRADRDSVRRSVPAQNLVDQQPNADSNLGAEVAQMPSAEGI